MTKHDIPIMVDGLLICKWSREIFEAMHRGGLTAANCTAAMPYANVHDSLRAAAQFHKWFVEYSDIIRPVYSTSDIHAAKAEGRVGIILGWQNTSGFDDYLPYIRVFRRLGVGVAQLTYNTMNSLGSGCLESNDHGLSDFGREFVAECNAAGMAIDLSHVGARTADDVIECSAKPVTYSHVSPTALFAHARNKTDSQIRKLADRGGLIGITLHPPFQAEGNDATLDDYLDSIEHCLRIAGENSIAIGTDFVTGHRHDTPEWEYLLRDKGHARRVFEIGEVRHPPNFASVADYDKLYWAMEARNWPARRIEKILGTNWIDFLREVWGD